MTKDEENELKDDMRTDMMNETHEDNLMRTDFNYCLEKLNVDEVVDSIKKLQHSLVTKHGWTITRKELYEHLEEYM